MDDSATERTLDAQAITAAFAGNASATARALQVPVKVVIKAVQLVTAERDWLLSLWGGWRDLSIAVRAACCAAGSVSC